MGFWGGLNDWVTRNISNPIQDLVGWQGDTGRVDRANGKSYGPPREVTTPKPGSQDQDSDQDTNQNSGGGQSGSTGPTSSAPVSKVDTSTAGGGISDSGAGYGSNVSNVEETTTLTNQNTVSPVTEVELSNQSQSNAQGSQSQSIQSQAQKANTYAGGGVTVAPVVSFDAADSSSGLTTFQLALIMAGSVGAMWLLKPKEEAEHNDH